MNFLSFNSGKSVASRLLVVLILSIIATGTTACSNNPEAPIAPTATPQPLAKEITPAPTNTPTMSPSVATAIPSPTATSLPVATPTLAIIYTTPTPTDTATPEPQESRFEDFGFSIVVEDQEAIVLTSILEENPSANQGILLFEYKGVQAVLTWMPSDTHSVQDVQAQLMALLTSAQPENAFTILNEGSITVDGNQGTYGAFSTQNAETTVTGGGIIGAWVCEGQGITPALLVAGTDDTTVQIRFKRLIDSFTCATTR
jgi:hypothetical protein